MRLMELQLNKHLNYTNKQYVFHINIKINKEHPYREMLLRSIFYLSKSSIFPSSNKLSANKYYPITLAGTPAIFFPSSKKQTMSDNCIRNYHTIRSNFNRSHNSSACSNSNIIANNLLSKINRVTL